MYDAKARTILITGGTGGIGRATATGLATQGATVIVTGRNRDRGEAALEGIRSVSRNPRVYFLKADLSRQRDVRDLAAKVRAHYPRLDVLVNNVGGLYADRWETEEGIEATLATNLLSPFLLTHELLPLLHTSTPARIINVTSGIHRLARVSYGDVFGRASYRGWSVYARAKLFGVLWTYELARRLAHTRITVNAADPGGANTPMLQAMKPKGIPAPLRPLWPAFRAFQQTLSVEKAATSTVYLAGSPDVAGISGAYFDADARPARSSAASYDRVSASEVWLLCERLLRLDPAEVRANLREAGQQAGIDLARVEAA